MSNLAYIVKVIGQIAIGILSLCILSFLGYATYRYVLPYWAAIAYYLYIANGLIIAIVGVVQIRQLTRPNELKEEVFHSIESAQSEKSAFKKIRMGIARAFISVEAVLLWPVNTFRAAYLRVKLGEVDPKHVMMHGGLKAIDHNCALFTVFALLILHGLGRFGATGRGYGLILVISFGATVVLRHFRYIVEPEGLPVRLRRISNHPYALFITIVTADFVSLTLVLTYLSGERSPLCSIT